jgi:PPOX class probable F420-dependent enzyme
MMDKFESLHKQQYINIETFRKNGEGVRTPVWFVQDCEVVYVHTVADSGKVKRIRREPRVNIAPCKMDGTPVGDWFSASAREIPDEETGRRVDKLLDKKYGLMKKLFGISGSMQKQKHTVLEIHPLE